MDICSLYDKFQEFKDLIIRNQSIKSKQQKEILKKFDSFLLKLENFSKGTNAIPAGKYRNVRNKLSAHRDRNVALHKIKSMWDSLNYKDIEDISKEIVCFYKYLENLGIYQWAKFNKNGTIEIVNDSPFIFPQRK